jgi:hypothetical protein
MDPDPEERLKQCDQTDPESRIREIRSSGSMRGEVEHAELTTAVSLIRLSPLRLLY